MRENIINLRTKLKETREHFSVLANDEMTRKLVLSFSPSESTADDDIQRELSEVSGETARWTFGDLVGEICKPVQPFADQLLRFTLQTTPVEDVRRFLQELKASVLGK